MSDGSDGGIRIGTAERESAVAALGEHLSAGRLDIDEYGERAARANLARTREELIALFADLPAPHPNLPAERAASAASEAASWPPAPANTGATHPRPDWGPPPRMRPMRVGPGYFARLLLAAPVVALVMVLAFHLWFFFLLIPLSGAVLRGRGRACGPRWRSYPGSYSGPRW